MTGVEIWGLRGEWKDTEKVHEIFCKRTFGIPSTAVNGVHVKRIGENKQETKSCIQEKIIGNGQDKFIKRCIKRAKHKERRELVEKIRKGTKRNRYGEYLEKGRGK
jgi:hypothetical protein